MKEQEKQQIEKILKQLAKEAEPDKEFGKMLQFKLKDKFTEFYSNDSDFYKPKTSLFGHLLKLKLRLITATTLVLFTSSTIYAYSSDSVTNGHILYPLKRSAEKVEGIFVKSPEAKTAYFNRMAERRIRELDYLEKQGRFDEETVVEANEFLNKAELEIARLPSENKFNIESTTTRQTGPENALMQPSKSETTLTDELNNRKKVRQKLYMNREILEKKIELQRSSEKLPTELKNRSIPSIVPKATIVPKRVIPINKTDPEIGSRNNPGIDPRTNPNLDTKTNPDPSSKLEIKDNQPLRIFDPEIFTSELTENPPSDLETRPKPPRTPITPENVRESDVTRI